ncbi:MAG: MATE family efflux transporter [Chloroflexota bacterium]|nr:MATE family efflux transporter [Chloroflexota bacterium]
MTAELTLDHTVDVSRDAEETGSAVTAQSRPVWREMLVFLIPILLGTALQSLGQLASSIVLGQWIGVTALATVAAFFPLFFLLISFIIGMESGASILIGQAYGARDGERLKAVVGTTLAFTFTIAVVLAVAGDPVAWELLRLLGTPANILADSVTYARIMFTSLPVLFLYFGYTTFIRGTGDSKTPLYFLILSTALNLLFLPALVFGWGFLPELGLYGSAYATVASTSIALASLMVYLDRVRHPLRFDSSVARHLRPDPVLLKLLLRLGIPSSVNMILVSLSQIVVISLVNRFGSNATAAYGAVNQVASYVQMPAISLAMAVSIFGAQAIGAGRSDRLQSVIRSGVLLNYAIGGTLILLLYIFSQNVLSLFLTDEGTLQIANSLLMITLWSYLIFGNAQVISAAMRSSGTVLWPTVFSVVSIWAVEVPIAYLLSTRTSLGLEGIWMGYPAAFAVSLAMQYAYYRLVWKRQTIVRLV